MRKLAYLLLLSMLAASLFLGGCGTNKEETKPEESAVTSEESTETEGKEEKEESENTTESVSVNISNLADEESRTELNAAFEKAGVSAQRQEVFWNHVDQFNDAIGADKLLSGYTKLNAAESSFDEYELQDLWNEKYSDFAGYNCRLTAFGLIGDLVHISDTSNPDTRNTFLDLDSANADGSVFTGENDRALFETLFSTIEGENSKDQDKQIEKVKKFWEEKGIKIDDATISLVSIYMHAHYDDNDNEIFVGHTGILIDNGDGQLYFVEKLAFQAPYRLIKLDSREQLKNYLLERYKEYQGADDAEAFVMENDKLM